MCGNVCHLWFCACVCVCVCVCVHVRCHCFVCPYMFIMAVKKLRMCFCGRLRSVLNFLLKPKYTYLVLLFKNSISFLFWLLVITHVIISKVNSFLWSERRSTTFLARCSATLEKYVRTSARGNYFGAFPRKGRRHVMTVF